MPLLVHPSAYPAPPKYDPYGTAPVDAIAKRPAATGSKRTFVAQDELGGTMYLDSAPGVWTQINNLDIELAFAQNVGNGGPTTVATSGTATELPNCTITVEPCLRPVWLECRAIFQQITAAAAGDAFLYIYEINQTTGVVTLLTNFTSPLPNSIGATTKFCDVSGRFRLGPVYNERSFMLAGLATAAAQAIGTLLNPHYLGAFAA